MCLLWFLFERWPCLVSGIPNLNRRFDRLWASDFGHFLIGSNLLTNVGFRISEAVFLATRESDITATLSLASVRQIRLSFNLQEARAKDHKQYVRFSLFLANPYSEIYCFTILVISYFPPPERISITTLSPGAIAPKTSGLATKPIFMLGQLSAAMGPWLSLIFPAALLTEMTVAVPLPVL